MFSRKRFSTKICYYKSFDYSPLGKGLKKQATVAEIQCPGLKKILNPDEKEEPVTI